MEIIIFKDKMWNEIPEQDNPAFDYVDGESKNGRNQKCLMITKVLPYRQKCVGQDGLVVIEVPLEGDVISRGLFWNLEDANLFAKTI